MQNVMVSETVEVGFSGTIRLLRTGTTMKCAIQYIAEDLSNIIVFASDPRVSMAMDVTLGIFLPFERSPITCTCRVNRVSEGLEQFGNSRGYQAQISIDHINRINRRRLELAIAQKKAFINSGRGPQLEEMASAVAETARQPGGGVGNSKILAAKIKSLEETLARFQERSSKQNERLEKAGRLDTHNILVVDDEVANLNALERTLRSLRPTLGDEYSIFLATNGRIALSVMEQNDIGFIIADQRMPGMTGIEFLEKTLEEHPDTIRIMLTAYTDEQLMLEAINKVRVHGFINKPWEPEEIKAIIQAGMKNQEIVRSHMLRDVHKSGLSLD